MTIIDVTADLAPDSSFDGDTSIAYGVESGVPGATLVADITAVYSLTADLNPDASMDVTGYLTIALTADLTASAYFTDIEPDGLLVSSDMSGDADLVANLSLVRITPAAGFTEVPVPPRKIEASSPTPHYKIKLP